MMISRLVFLKNCLCFLLLSSLIGADQANVNCLRTIKSQVGDPNDNLSTWVFGNNTAGYICKFSGVTCWHDDENRVLSINLSGFGLTGVFPRGIRECSDLTALDLSRNNFSGPLPSNLTAFIPLVTILDLSFNHFDGPVPLSITNITFLNTLFLHHNRFSGSLPPQLVFLGRLSKFSVADNRLTGAVPNFNSSLNIGRDSFANNPGLCGGPLDACQGSSSSSSRGKTVVAAAVGGLTIAALVVGIGLFFYFRKMAVVRRKNDDPEGNKWAKSLEGQKGVKVFLFKKSVSQMKLRDLMKATDDFKKDNIIGKGRTGAMYKGVLEDGTPFMIKRLQDSQRSKKELESEMKTLGSVKHRNLVSLLGYCIANKEKLLIYEYMPNGYLYDTLHPAAAHEESSIPMDWPSRLKVAIGAAKGLAWLHHSCNPRIIHRNISSKCILLTADYEPKISDFGLARLMNPVDTHLSTFVNGEFGDFGYVAPEYSRTMVATPKGDVYSFGVVLLELVTGQKATSVEEESFKGNLVEWITMLSSESKLQEAIDKSLLGKSVDDEIFKVLKVACSCVLQEVPKQRPTMFEVYQLLRAIGENYNFTTDDDILVPSESVEADFIQELIVAR